MDNKLVQEAIEVWCPNYPRKCSGLIGNNWGQVDAYNSDQIIYNLNSINKSDPSYVSTYSFPDGHPSDNSDSFPKIDTIMIDFDFDFDKEEFDHDEWRRKLGDLLTRIRIICDSLIENEYEKYWRASLSGFKGVHLYFDFPAISNDLGLSEKYRNGLSEFTDIVIDSIKSQTNIHDLEDYIDVSSGYDPSRLTRIPNTLHEKATATFEEDRYCVPISIELLSKVGVREYIALTKNPRNLDNVFRFPNVRTKKKLERIIKTSSSKSSTNFTESIKSEQLYEDYIDKRVNDRIELEDVEFLLKRKPCIWEFHKNRDKFTQGSASHIMEIQSILAMKSIGTPIEVMKEFFAEFPDGSTDPNYSEDETEKRIKQILSRNYGEFNCSSILEDAPQFCMKNSCKIYQNNEDLQAIH